MGSVSITLIFLVYFVLLFVIAAVAERGDHKLKSLFSSPTNYALSLTVYCTAWTLMGSVGQAANEGLSFLPIYLGPLMLSPVWPFLVRKIIRISKLEGITSLPDFISSRYGKSVSLGAIATVFLVIGTIPYISIQLKAVTTIFDFLIGAGHTSSDPPFYQDSGLQLTLVLILFTVIYGARRLDANGRHTGVIATIAFEAVVKLACFLAVGLFVLYIFFGGPQGFFNVAATNESLSYLWTFEASKITGWDWFWLNLISMCAIVLLPRQFHVTVVENERLTDVNRAAWLFPLYLLLINLFVIPIAAAGVLYFGENGLAQADAFVLQLPAAFGYQSVAIVAGLGGFAAATGMVIISSIALSLMISNNLVLPYIFGYSGSVSRSGADLSRPLLMTRRLIIMAVLLLAYGFYQLVAARYSLVAIGLISFTAVAQFAPSLLAGLYWEGANRNGALWGLLVGFAVWAYTLALPMSPLPFLNIDTFVEHGPWGIHWLRPHQLFGAEGMSPIAHGAFWSLSANVFFLCVGSLMSRPSALELSQADLFVNDAKHRANETAYSVRRRSALVRDLIHLLSRFNGMERANQQIANFHRQYRLTPPKAEEKASPALINFVEQQLAGAIGTASAQILIRTISKEKPIELQEVITILRRTQEAVDHSRVLEQKQTELEELTQQLRAANDQLKQLDRLKAEFISTVTHELRTPITSVKSLANILLDTPDLTTEKRMTFLKIIVSESKRLARLVSQVLDVDKIERQLHFEQAGWQNLGEVIDDAVSSLQGLAAEKGITIDVQLTPDPIFVAAPADRLTQVVVNLVGNAIKFVPTEDGRIEVSLRANTERQLAELRVRDNGPGIPPEKEEFIFQRFTQISSQKAGKPSGSGLGLYITKTIIDKCGGQLKVERSFRGGASFLVSLPYRNSLSFTVEPLPPANLSERS
ncbi:MAG: sensor histidine kinase [Bacteroidota bacterium]